MSATHDDPTEALISNSAWLRGLARKLLSDEARAEDAVQDTLAAALEHPPEGGRTGPRWLATVLRNFVRQELRSGGRRRARELESAAQESEPSTLETVERLALQRRVVSAVEALDEPFRTTIVLRFLDGLAPREIARRTSAPVKTVNSRIQRGLARLRVTLDAEFGGRRDAWATALLPFASAAPAAVSAATLGAILMSTKTVLTLSLSAVCLVGYAALRSPEERPAEAPTDVARAGRVSMPGGAIEPVAAPIREPADSSLAARKSLTDPASIATPDPEPAAAARRTFTGEVMDIRGEGIAGLAVEFHSRQRSSSNMTEAAAGTVTETAAVTSGLRGAFEMALPTKRGQLRATGRGYATVFSPVVDSEKPVSTPRVVVALACDYSGIVVDTDGNPLEGAEVTIELDSEALRLTVDAHLVPSLSRTQSNALGEFAFQGIGAVPGSSLLVELSGYESRWTELQPSSQHYLRIVLAVPERGFVRGEVLDRSGLPIAGAWVALDRGTTRTDDQGNFKLHTHDERGDGLVRAVHPGFLPAERTLERNSDGRWQSEEALVLVLDQVARKISGRVEDASGSPIANAQVWTFDGVPFGDIPSDMLGTRFSFSTDVESLIAGSTGGFGGRETLTASDGSFELNGLVDARYTLFALHPITQESIRVDAVQAGASGVTLRFRNDEPLRRVAGRVLDDGGQPLQGVSVQVRRRFDTGAEHMKSRSAGESFKRLTDANGEFEFESLVTRNTTVEASGMRVPAPLSIDLVDGFDFERLVFRVPSECHVRILLARPEEADSIGVQDEAGNFNMMFFDYGGVIAGADRVHLSEGGSIQFSTDTSARYIVLFQGDQEVRRTPIELISGQLNELQL